MGDATDKKTILAIDDDKRTLDMLRVVLADYKVVFAQSGEDARGLALELRPDLIVSDMVMPELYGFDLLQWFKREPSLRDIPVVMVTGVPLPDDEKRLVGEEGAAAYFNKPLPVRKFLATIKTLLGDVEETEPTLGDFSDDGRF